MKKIIISFYIIFQISFLNINPSFCQYDVQDSLALVDLYNATNGDNWTDNTNWLITPVRYWFGIFPEYPLLNRAKYIELINNNLVGYIPNSFGNLTHLYSIEMGGNVLTGAIPESFGNLTNLSHLDFTDNQLTEPLPASISNLTNLIQIGLQNNNFSGSIPEFLANVPNLIHLNLSHNHFSKSIPDSLCNLTNITWLDLSYNELNGELPQNFGNIGSNAGPAIFLNNNELTGAIPNSMLNYNYFRLNIRNNNFTELPVFLVTQYEPYLWLENNKFTFEDLEQNMFLDSMYYIPQDSVLTPQTLTARLDSPFTLTSTVCGTANHYQWFKNGDTLQGAIDSILYFPFVAWADSGVYTCHITNDIVTGLTLTRHLITLNVSDTITSNFKLQTSNFKLKVYPIPANDVLMLDIKYSELTHFSFTLFDVTGRNLGLLNEGNYASSHLEFNISDIAKGIYYIKVETDKNSFCKKIIKE